MVRLSARRFQLTRSPSPVSRRVRMRRNGVSLAPSVGGSPGTLMFSEARRFEARRSAEDPRLASVAASLPIRSSHSVEAYASTAGGSRRACWRQETSITYFGGCSTPDPFLALGGGRCINGGWYPPSAPSPSPTPSPTPTPIPTPTPGGCTTPDPFVALGGGTCVNGGWFPPGMGAPAPPPPPTPVPGGCLTPDPFVALGGGRCINGGWYPPGMGSSATSK